MECYLVERLYGDAFDVEFGMQDVLEFMYAYAFYLLLYKRYAQQKI